MKEIYLFRHGTTQLNAEKRFSGRGDCPLSPEGVAQGQALGRIFAHCPLDLCLVSPLRRAMDPARLIFPARPDSFFWPDQRLAEVDFGRWEGWSQDQLALDPYYEKWLANAYELPAPGGESFADVERRLLPLAGQLRDMAEKRVAVVSHFAALGALLTLLLAGDTRQDSHYNFISGRYSWLTIDQGFAKLQGLNLTPADRPVY